MFSPSSKVDLIVCVKIFHSFAVFTLGVQADGGSGVGVTRIQRPASVLQSESKIHKFIYAPKYYANWKIFLNPWCPPFRFQITFTCNEECDKLLIFVSFHQDVWIQWPRGSTHVTNDNRWVWVVYFYILIDTLYIDKFYLLCGK